VDTLNKALIEAFWVGIHVRTIMGKRDKFLSLRVLSLEGYYTPQLLPCKHIVLARINAREG
jgi:hypothetical protein